MNPQIAASSHGIIKIIFEPTVSEKAFTTPLVRRVGKKKKNEFAGTLFPKKKRQYENRCVFVKAHISTIVDALFDHLRNPNSRP